MYIKKLQLQNFKRFTDLTIDLAPNGEEAPKLVLLIGQNGCGKSSIFDAFNTIQNHDGKVIDTFKNYCIKKYNKISWNLNDIDKNKNNESEATIELINMSFVNSKKQKEFLILKARSFVELNNKYNIEEEDSDYISSWGTEHFYVEKSNNCKFYGRNSIKTVPTLELTVGTNFAENVENNLDAPNLLIDRDERVKSNFAFYNNLRDEFGSKNRNRSEVKNDKEFYAPFTESLATIFNYNSDPEKQNITLEFDYIKPNTTQGKAYSFWFKKNGTSVEYEMLSMGEKQVIDTLLDIIIRKEFYTDSIVYFDELDLHLHTDLQYGLLKEIMRILEPLNSQVWVASHSLGFIDYTREYDKGAIIDFDSLDFDIKQDLKPSKTIDVFDIAIPKSVLKTIFSGKTIIFCENTDANYYNLAGIKDIIFIGAKDKYEVLARCNEGYFGIIDRDYLEDSEFELMQKKYPNLHILNYYTFENYLYHPDNIKEVNVDFDAEKYKTEITQEKNVSLLDIEINKARSNYSVIKNLDTKIRENTGQLIKADLKSDDFETFYKYHKMKQKGVNIEKPKLSKTKWLKEQIEQIIKK